MKTSSKYVIIFDLETGGLCSKDKLAFYDVPIVESAMVVVDMEKLEICDECSLIVERDYKEGLIYEQQAIDVHGITEEIQNSKGVSLKSYTRSGWNYLKNIRILVNYVLYQVIT